MGLDGSQSNKHFHDARIMIKKSRVRSLAAGMTDLTMLMQPVYH